LPDTIRQGTSPCPTGWCTPFGKGQALALQGGARHSARDKPLPYRAVHAILALQGGAQYSACPFVPLTLGTLGTLNFRHLS